MALSYKEEGNYHFKAKKYSFAKTSFAEGLKQKFDDDNLRSQLYNNRGAAEFYSSKDFFYLYNC